MNNFQIITNTNEEKHKARLDIYDLLGSNCLFFIGTPWSTVKITLSRAIIIVLIGKVHLLSHKL